MIRREVKFKPFPMREFLSPSERENLILNEHSLLKEYKNRKPVLDFIYRGDLEAYYDSFLIPDDPNHLDGRNYKVRLRFSPSIVDPKTNDELGVISRIVEKRRLNPILLEHPLVCVFLALKWHAMKNYFWTALFLQAFLFLLTGYLLHVSSSNVFLTTVEFFLFIFNAVIKFMIFFDSENRSVFTFSNRASIHGLMELLLILTQALAFFDRQFRVFVFTEMTVCFFLTAGYYYENTKFGFFLEKFFKVASYLLTISMIFYFVCYLFDYHIEENIFKYFATAAFNTYNMTAKVDIEDIKFDKIDELNLYALLPIFLPKIVSFIVKLWSEKSEKDDDDEEINEETKIDALKYTLSFMKFVERLYKRDPFNIIHKYFPNPFLFSFVNRFYDRNNACEVVLYVNRKKKQFGNNLKKYPSKLDKDCIEKIKSYCKEAEKYVLKQHLQDIQSKLETLEKLLKDKVIPKLS